jgi:small subunit ribosomal protein S16
MFRVIVQESRFAPTSGKVVAALGSYDPHSKAIILDKEKAALYLKNGAQPSDRVVRLLKTEGVKLPDWVKLPTEQKRETRNPDKRRSTRPDEPEAPATEEPAAAETEAPVEEAPSPEEAEAPSAEETPAAEDVQPAESEAASETKAPVEES